MRKLRLRTFKRLTQRRGIAEDMADLEWHPGVLASENGIFFPLHCTSDETLTHNPLWNIACNYENTGICIPCACISLFIKPQSELSDNTDLLSHRPASPNSVT